MSAPRDIRRLAFQALFQLDAAGARTEADLEPVRAALSDREGVTEAHKVRAVDLAWAAYRARAAADAEMLTLAPAWPAHRQAAVDRAILRLAHYEMTSGRTEPRVVVNEAVELAKEFSTERSPAFVNALLDKVLKRLGAEARAASAGAEPAAQPGDGAREGSG
jgi:N utilization substance protein B